MVIVSEMYSLRLSFMFLVSSFFWFLLVIALADRRLDSAGSVPKFVLVFNVKDTLVSCTGQKGLDCSINKDTLKFLQWARKEALNPDSVIDPQFVAWANAPDSLKQLDSAFRRYQKENKQIDASTLQDYNLATYFTGSRGTAPLIIEPELKSKGSLSKNPLPQNTKGPRNLMDLRDRLIRLRTSHAFGSPFLYFTNDLNEAKYNGCYKQFSQRGLLPVIIEDSRTGQPNFGKIETLLSNQLVSRDAETKGKLLERFDIPQTFDCSYSWKEPDRLYSALIINLEALNFIPLARATAFFNEFLWRLSSISSNWAADPFDVLLFSCDSKLRKDGKCLELKKALIPALAQIMHESRSSGSVPWLASLKLIDFVVTRTSSKLPFQDATLIGVATSLPQDSTMIIQIGGQTAGVQDVKSSKTEDTPNMCYLANVTSSHRPSSSKGMQLLSSLRKAVASEVAPKAATGTRNSWSDVFQSEGTKARARNLGVVPGALEAREVVSTSSLGKESKDSNPLAAHSYMDVIGQVLETFSVVRSRLRQGGSKGLTATRDVLLKTAFKSPLSCTL